MSIRLLRNINNVGVANDTVTLNPAIEAGLVSANNAVYTSGPDIGDSSVPVSARTTLTGGIELSSVGGQPVKALPRLNGRLCFFGDSLTATGIVGAFTSDAIGKSWHGSTGYTSTELGGGAWVASAMLGASATANGSLRTDGYGAVQFNYNGEGYGPLVDVRAGGFYVLKSGGQTDVECLVSVRGGTPHPTVAGEGALTRSGLIATISSENYGYRQFVHAHNRFAAVETWAISGSKSTDVLGYIRQAVDQPGVIAASVMMCGTNDAPVSSAAALELIENLKTNIKLLAQRSGVVYVGGIPPNTSVTATVRRYYQLVNESIRGYCSEFSNVRFWNPWAYLSDPSAAETTLRAGAFHSDNLHFRPYGGYLCAKPLNALLDKDFPADDSACNMGGKFDPVLGVGQWNVNPTLRGTAGTVVAGKGVTGTAPDGWTITRNASAQTLVTSFTPASDGGLSWFTMAYSNGDGADYHRLQQTVAVPSGVNVGDYFVVGAEICVFGQTGNGISALSVQTYSGQFAYAMAQFSASRSVSTFANENPVMLIQSPPQLLLAGTTSLPIEMRLGGATGATGSVGLRNLSIRKV